MQLLAMDELKFRQNLQSKSDNILGEIQECGLRLSFPLH